MPIRRGHRKPRRGLSRGEPPPPPCSPLLVQELMRSQPGRDDVTKPKTEAKMCPETPRLKGTWAGEKHTVDRRGKRGLQGQGGEVPPPHSSMAAHMPTHFHHGFLVGMDSKWVPSHVLGGRGGGRGKGVISPKSIHPERTVTPLASAFGSSVPDVRVVGDREGWQPGPSSILPPFPCLSAACQVKVSKYLTLLGLRPLCMYVFVF